MDNLITMPWLSTAGVYAKVGGWVVVVVRMLITCRSAGDVDALTSRHWEATCWQCCGGRGGGLSCCEAASGGLQVTQNLHDNK